MDLEKLRQLLLDMHHSGRLADISPHLYDETREYLEKLKNDYYALANPLETRAGSLIIEEIGSIRDTTQEIFSIRTRQILDLAFQQFEGQYTDRDESRKMLPAERVMFRQIVGAIEECRRTLIFGDEAQGLGEAAGDEPVAGSMPAAPKEKRKRAASAGGVAAEYALVHITQDMDSFMGVDGRVYHLRQGDIITIPERNADVLCERNIALNIRLNK
ncbi:hypothetical protein ABH15_03505 [Methanoculleus taiwanensis]|uniref:DNA replication complex GINS family protein n=1 Tax=Methanoculleus taiwanensis TaxID=1550565 RepID=A0A498H2M7_9EURY|nr:DNA replication complex GINS family protein [Methanoculleus taiwanensis]RXE57192.1 hypothetical protein ABH15_03505 [Methanoculleus taiwanensis]